LKNAESAGLCNTTSKIYLFSSIFNLRFINYVDYVRVRTPDEKEIAPGIFVPDIPAGTSAVNDDDDEICLVVLDNVENLGLYDIQGMFIFLFIKLTC